MKRMIRILALVLVLALSVCALASCAPAGDPGAASGDGEGGTYYNADFEDKSDK